jgi:hypothetical protein
MKNEYINCKKCDKKIHWLEIFTGNMCIDCFGLAFDNLTDKEKIAHFNSLSNDFKNTLTIN